MGVVDDLKYKARQQRAPVTLGLLAALLVISLFFWLSASQGIENLVFAATAAASRPWTFLTYPLAYQGLNGAGALIFFLFLIFWMLFASAQVEREMGSGRYAIFWVAMTLLGSLVFFMVPVLGMQAVPLFGPTLPLAAVTVAWGTRNPNQSIMLYGLLPLSGKWLAWLTVALTLFGFGVGQPLVGVMACIPLGVAFLVASGRVPFFPFSQAAAMRQQTEKREKERDDRYFDEVKRREKEREERERLRKLFESSLDDDGSKDR